MLTEHDQDMISTAVSPPSCVRPKTHTLGHTGLGPHLVKAKERDLPRDVDARGAYAEDPFSLQTTLGVNGTGGDSSGEGRGHHNGHNIQSPNHQLPPRGLETQLHFIKK